tara:strand:- start:408 stop:869 length:462 start_codon:yes stop_codon:yes gene_type:complete
MKLSENLSLNEVIKSNIAIRRGIDNNPTQEHLEALEDIADNIFQPIREHFKVSIGVTSGYRSRKLNEAVDGSKDSQHSKGEALDLDADMYGKITNKQIFNFIKDNLVFDQLIWEFGTDNEPNWVHVSFTTRRPNRMIILKAYKSKGKNKYKTI